MRIYLASTENHITWFNPMELGVLFLLNSFYYVRNRDEYIEKVVKQINKNNYLLDSGAFTFMQGGAKNIDIDKFTDDYIAFINKYDIKYFFEMDVDACYPYSKVLELRQKIEKQTGKKCIPVFHISRGYSEWKKLLDEYDYIAIGGIAFSNKKDEEFYCKLVKEANSKGVKVHGLGFTRINSNIPFYSVDSTSWNSNRFGTMYGWDNKEKKLYKSNTVKGKQRIKAEAHAEVSAVSFKAWVQYQKYMYYGGKKQ